MAALELVVTRAQEGRTVKSLLKGELGFSTALIGRLKRTETGLTVNGRRVFANAVLREGDRLSVDLPTAERPTELRPVPMALDVRFEDEHLLVVNKPAPLASIPSSLVPGEPTLAAGLLYHLGEGSALHLVNRLDRGTTGLAAAAKTAYVHELLRRRLHTGAFHRTYLAVCLGGPAEERGRVELPIGRDPASAVKRRIDPAVPGPGASRAVCPGGAGARNRADPPAAGPYGRAGVPPGGGLAVRDGGPGDDLPARSPRRPAGAGPPGDRGAAGAGGPSAGGYEKTIGAGARKQWQY